MSRSFRAVLLGVMVVVGLLIVGCTPAEPPPRTVRLLDLGGDTTVDWPEDVEPPPALSAAGIGEVPAPGRVVRMAMTVGERLRDDRPALLAPSGSRYRFDLRLPSDAVFRSALGYSRPPDNEEGSARFLIRITTTSTEAVVILDRTLTTTSQGAWQDLELPLGEWAGERITLELEVAPSSRPTPTWAGWAAPEIVSASDTERGWDLILISLDTLRADRLSCYGNLRSTSRHLDALAARGVRFATAVSQSPWTRPSHRSLLSGVYPLSHRGFRSTTLATTLWRAGYRTLAFTGGGQLDGRFGFAEGFDVFRTEDWIQSIEGATDWLEKSSGRRRFLFLHTYEIHDPYTHTTFAEGLPAGRMAPGFSKKAWQHLRGESRKITEEERAYVEALYDSGIAYTDERLGRLFEALESTGVLDRAVVIVTSDHGEQFWEHGTWGHGQTVYEHQLRVPLILHLPPELRRQLERGGSGSSLVARVVTEQVSLVDLYPTILDLLGIPLEHRVQGRSLRPLLEGGSLPEQDAFAEHTNIPRFERKALRTERFKLIYSYPKATEDAVSRAESTEGSERVELYDLGEDPAEQFDLAGERPGLKDSLFERLRAIIGEAGAPLEETVPDDLDPELKKRLEALGYL